jgi:hypothetical protein
MVDQPRCIWCGKPGSVVEDKTYTYVTRFKFDCGTVVMQGIKPGLHTRMWIRTPRAGGSCVRVQWIKEGRRAA